MNDPDRIDPLALINKLAQQEKRLAEQTFLAPLVQGGKVRVRVDSIVYELAVEDTQFQGWGLFQMTGPGSARLIEPAALSAVNEYLKLFVRKKFVLIDQFEGHWFGLASSASDTRFVELTGPVPLQLVSRAACFDTVNVRFDGSVFWFEAVDRRRDPTISRTMRIALEETVRPEDLRCPGMSSQERLAYKILWLHKYGERIVEANDARSRVSRALQHADATLDSFWYEQSGDVASVRFLVDGRVHVVSLRPDDLSIVSAGICLNGKDRDFDLSSLVGVFREHRRSGLDDYW